MFRRVFEEHRDYISALTASRTAAGSANSLVYIVSPSNPADNCFSNAVCNALTTLTLNVTWKTNAACPFISHND